jgi:hypothetical protein
MDDTGTEGYYTPNAGEILRSVEPSVKGIAWRHPNPHSRKKIAARGSCSHSGKKAFLSLTQTAAAKTAEMYDTRTSIRAIRRSCRLTAINSSVRSGLFLAGIVMLSTFASPDRSFILGFGIGFICLGAYILFARRRGVKYTFFNVKDGKIRIVQDKQHDIIPAWRNSRNFGFARLRKLHGAINTA